MKVINKNNIISSKKIFNICNLLNIDYLPRKIIIYETRFDVLKSFLILDPISLIMTLLGKIEGTYNILFDRVCIFIFSENDDGDDIHSKQFYSLHALLHELRHRHQWKNSRNLNEDDADEFATNFLNNNSEKISKIMGWEDEWEIEEE